MSQRAIGLGRQSAICIPGTDLDDKVQDLSPDLSPLGKRMRRSATGEPDLQVARNSLLRHVTTCLLFLP